MDEASADEYSLAFQRYRLFAAVVLAATCIQLGTVDVSLAAQPRPTSLDIAVGIVANEQHDAAMIRTAEAARSPEVSIDGTVTARWVPIDEPLVAKLRGAAGLALRSGPSGATEVLVLLPMFRVSQRDMAAIGESSDRMGKPAAAVCLNENAKQRLFAVSGRWVGRFVAFVIDDRVRCAAKVQARISGLSVSGPFATEYLSRAKVRGHETSTGQIDPVKAPRALRFWFAWVGVPLAALLFVAGLLGLRRRPQRIANWFSLGGFLIGGLVGSFLLGPYRDYGSDGGGPANTIQIEYGFSLLWGGVGAFVGCVCGAAFGCLLAAVIRRVRRGRDH